jgi:hypothetical protein
MDSIEKIAEGIKERSNCLELSLERERKGDAR